MENLSESHGADVTYHRRSHHVTCHPTKVNAACFNPSLQTGRHSIYLGLPRKDGRLSWSWCWLYTKMV